VTDNPVVREEMFKKLMGKNFIPLERKIVHMHYYENMTIKEISEKLGFSESRICQMHGKIIERLQKKAQLNPQYMEGIENILQS
jgi:RNA polymerase sigma factor for flagellar operon FliA